MEKRVVNCRFTCCGLHFDAAIDCGWDLHAYGDMKKDVTPIELYCFDHPEWDVRMMWHCERNDQRPDFTGILRTCCDLDAIRKEARKWVREMR